VQACCGEGLSLTREVIVMENEQGYWKRDEHGRYVWVPRRSTFLADWFKYSAIAFVVMMGLLILFWAMPFPHIEVWGLVLHP